MYLHRQQGQERNTREQQGLKCAACIDRPRWKRKRVIKDRETKAGRVECAGRQEQVPVGVLHLRAECTTQPGGKSATVGEKAHKKRSYMSNLSLLMRAATSWRQQHSSARNIQALQVRRKGSMWAKTAAPTRASERFRLPFETAASAGAVEARSKSGKILAGN